MIIYATYDKTFDLHHIEPFENYTLFQAHLHTAYRQLCQTAGITPMPEANFLRQTTLAMLETLFSLNPAISRDYLVLP